MTPYFGEAAYLGDMHDAGIKNFGGDDGLLETGYGMCDMLDSGYTFHEVVAVAAPYATNGLSRADVVLMVNSASDNLC